MVECNDVDWFDEDRVCPECGGDVHAHFVDEMQDGYILYFHCHKCGESFFGDDWEEMPVMGSGEGI